MPADFYDLLEVSEDASETDVKAAYRRKAREYHPDVNDDERATAQFTTVRKAYEVLSDGTERAAYDRLGHETYVAERLEGLPTGVIDRMTGGRSTVNGTSRRNRDGTATTGGRTASDRTGTASGSTSSPGRTSSAGSNATGTYRTVNDRTADTGAGAGADAAAGSGTTQTAASAAGAETTSGPGATSGPDAGTRSEAAARRERAERRRRSRGDAAGRSTDGSRGRHLLPLAWGAVLLAAVAYAAGLGAYLSSVRDPVFALLSALSTDPIAALSAPAPAVGTFVAGVLAGSAPPASVLMLIGTVALPLTLGVTVSRFGRGTAWLYVLCALGPSAVVVAAVAAPSATRPIAVDALLLVVVPVAATLVFLWDVGRYLRSSA